MIESYEERNWWEYPRIFAKNFWYKYKTDPYFEEKVDLIVSRVLLILAAVAFAASTGGIGMVALAVGTIAVSAVSGFFRMRKIHKLEILEVKTSALEKFAAALECRNRLIDLLPGKSKRDIKSLGSREAFDYSGLDKKQKSHGDRVLSIIRDHVLDKVSSVVMIANQGMLIGEISSAAQFLFSGLKEAHARAKSGDRRKYNASVLESLDKRFNLDSKLPVDKPAGVTVHPGAGTADDTLVHGLIYRFGKNLSDVGGKDRPGIVHRLDKNTSGLMLVAKTNRAHLRLSQMIKDKEIKRSYIAITLGMPKPSSGVIESNITRSSVDRKKMAITDFGGKKSVTNYSTKQIFKNGLASLVECNLETGRTHQIRVHLNSIGAPILGDPDYGTTKSYKLQILGKKVLDELNKLKRQALHSYSLSFTHCYTGEKLNFQSSLPDDINRLVNILK